MFRLIWKLLDLRLFVFVVRSLAEAITRRRAPNRWKGLLLGAAAGALGTFVMGLFFKLSAGFAQRAADDEPDRSGPRALDDISLAGKQYQQGEGSTAAAGRIVYQALAGRPPETDETKAVLSELIHWSFGISMGALYGAARGPAAFPDARGGLVFGSCVWLFGSELAVPLLGLSPGPSLTPPAQHANHFAGHLAYGLTVAATTQALQRAL